MSDRIVLFDLNGTLDTEEGLEFYKEQKRMENTHVGVLTSNALVLADTFISENDIEPDSINRGFIKSKEMILMSLRLNPDEQIYVGDAFTDRFAARIAGWEYIDVSDLADSR